MKKVIFTVALALTASTVVAQTTENSVTKLEITSIKPADASPVVYPTQEELDAKNAGKIVAIQDQIKANLGNSEKVEYLRKELWRFENAIVATKNK